MAATGVIALLMTVTLVLGLTRLFIRSPLLGYLAVTGFAVSLTAVIALIIIIASM